LELRKSSTLTAIAGAERYRIQVALDSSFGTRLHEALSETPALPN
jgi:hypothetical protein